MRKSLIALLLPVFLVSCDKLSQTSIPSEIALSPSVTCMETRGYVEGSTLDDSDDGAARVIYLSAYDVTDSKNYFSGSTFKLTGGQWHNFNGSEAEPLYWPAEHSLRFLAYSASTNPKAIWPTDNNTKKLDLYVTEGSLQDDILYGRTDECRCEGTAVNINFSHTQTWVEVEISSAYTTPVTIDDITFKNTFTSGQLTIDNTGSAAVCRWDFSGAVARSCKIAPESGTISSDSESVKISVLLPAQSAQEFVVNYMSGGTAKSATIGKKTPVWEMGAHYIYKVMVSPMLTRAGTTVATEDTVEVELLQKPW